MLAIVSMVLCFLGSLPNEKLLPADSEGEGSLLPHWVIMILAVEIQEMSLQNNQTS